MSRELVSLGVQVSRQEVDIARIFLTECMAWTVAFGWQVLAAQPWACCERCRPCAVVGKRTGYEPGFAISVVECL